MMKSFILGIIALATCTMAQAKNTVQSVEQVTQTVTLTTDVDYQITGTTPFGAMGSVDIQNTEHAVLIIRNIKPSKVLANLMNHIFIKGEAAVDGTNCQVKMYDRGAIILPYGSNYRPLTCYTEENYGGTSNNNYTEGHSGGYMKTLNASTLNNNIRSFKLKRGYMVTFATGVAGWGYSRVFIADQEDLEIPVVPTPLNGKISSYRLFKWWNAHKAGGASSGDYNFNQAINASWCYDWATGNASLLPDVEWVPNHIYEDWPSSSACGSVTGSCHMKTNNEPGNSADDHPQSVNEILNNWQNLMRTGMRLCSESSHDGSWAHLRAFIDSIDARGWRCDLLDLHCYWGAGSFGDFSNYYRDYGGRPIWISEWLWGASWNSGNWSNGGIFAQAPDGADSYSTRNQQTMYDNTKPILDKLNASRYVERYAIWNGERAASKIYKDGSLSILGKYYATMNDGMGYDASIQKVPTIVYRPTTSFNGTYTKRKASMDLEWTDPNGDLIDSMVVECKRPGTTKFVAIASVYPQDMSSKADNAYTYSDSPKEAGLHTYRLVTYVGGAKKFTTGEIVCTVSAANAVGSLQYGQLKVGDDQSVTTDLEPQDVAPYVVMGMISNNNTANGIANQIQTLSKSSFKFRFQPWTLETPVSFDKAETIDYLCLPADTVLHLSDDFMLISKKIGNVKGDEVSVTFPEAFPEGTKPVVVAQQNTSIASYAPVVVKVYDVTNTGFKVRLIRQEGITSTFNAQNVNYFAGTPGQISIGGGKLLTIGRNEQTRVGGSSRQTVAILSAAGDTLHLVNPTIIAAPQTNNYVKASIFRMHSTSKTTDGVYAMSIRRQIDPSNKSTEVNSTSVNGDFVGWFIISDDPTADGNEPPLITPTGINETITTTTSSLPLYDLSGRRITTPAKGIYIQGGKKIVR